jgi:hypothetical protein
MSVFKLSISFTSVVKTNEMKHQKYNTNDYGNVTVSQTNITGSAGREN